MTKQAFLDELNRLTGGLGEAERARLVDYYREMIEDRVEEGVSEAEAVAALGNPADIALEFAPADAQASAAGGSETVEALRSLRVRVANADVKIVGESLDSGAAAQLRFSDPERFEWRMDGDALVVQERRPEDKHRGLEYGLRWLKQMISESGLRVTIALSKALTDALDFEGGGSDLRVEGVAFAKARLITASGDITLKDVACEGGIGINLNTHSGDMKLTDVSAANLMVHTGSGDLTAQRLRLSGQLRLESASGDIELRDVGCGALTAVTASGDIEADRCRAAGTVIRSASGDVRLDEVESDPTLAVDTASGDVDLTRCIARETRVKTASGDVDLRLEPLPCGYDIIAHSVSGSIHFDDGTSADAGDPEKPKIDIRTVSGDIEARPV